MAPSRPSEPTSFKSRFSLLPLLPSRHPPLQISHPRPLLPSELPIRSVPRYDTHRLPDLEPPRVVSQYASPLTSYSYTPSTTFEYHTSTPSKGRRPPPIDLNRIRAAYPTEQAINGAGEVNFGKPNTPYPISPDERDRSKLASPPILPPLPPIPALKKKKSKRKKPMGVKDDPFDVAIVEPGHRYDSWQGGKVDIRPGQVIPRDLAGMYSGGKGGKRGTIRGEAPEEEGEVYDSVLQHVLLTPTYLQVSPPPKHHSTHYREERRDTMLEKAKRISRLVPALPSAMKRGDSWAPRPVKDMRDREGREMEQCRKGQGFQMGLGSTSAPGCPVGKGPRSPGVLGEKEARVGIAPREYERYDSRDLRDVKGGAMRRYESRERRRNCWGLGTRKRSKEDTQEMSMRRRLFIKFRCLVLFLLLLIAAVVVAAVLLTRKQSSSSSPASSGNLTIISPSLALSASGTSSPLPSQVSAPATSAPAPTATSRTLQTCLDLYSSSSTTAYPCSDCTPLLLGTINDYTTPLVNGNSTGVGAALQYCTMMDVLAAGSRSGFEGIGWTGKGTCTWSGVKCDARGRVTELSLNYPNVPYRFPSTIGQIPTLNTLRIKGNSSVPAGPFPSSLITSTLVTLDISDTALQGPIATFDFRRASALTTVYLANNPILGSGTPDFRDNGRLLTLAMTGQLLSTVPEANLPSSLTYLDLSFNALFGQVPSFASLTGLKTLYLESNQYTNAPSSLPAGLSDLKMNNNPSLRGGMPEASCNAAALASCDLRNTGLGGSMSGGNAARTCGRCLY